MNSKKNTSKIGLTNLNVESASFALDQHSLVSIANIDGTIVYANQKFCEVSGYSEKELLGKKHNILNSGQKTKDYWKSMHDQVLRGKVWHDEVRNRAKNGSFYWVDTTIVPNFDEAKKVVGFTSIRTDITKQKEMIEQLAHAKEQAEAAKFALDQHSLVSITKLDGTITYVNERFEKVSGYSKQELIGRKHSILNSGLQPKAYWQQMHGKVLSGEVWHDEVRNRAKDGSRYWVDTTIVPNYNNRGEINGFTSIRTDITEQKEHLEQIAAAKQQAEAAKFALDQHSLVSITDINGTIVYVNDLFGKVSGYTSEELIGRKHNILNSGLQPKAYWQKMHGTVLSGKVWHDEVRNRAKNGSYYWVDTTIVPNYNTRKEVIGFTSIRTDITQQKANIENLAIAKHKAELANIAKANFLANMSHEVRTPMNGVYGNLQILQEEELNEKARKHLENAVYSVKSLMTIVNDILDFSKIEAGKLTLETISFSLSQLLENVVSDFGYLAKKKGIELKTIKNVEHDDWLGDPTRIRQILLNITSNAIKFTEHGGVTLDSYFSEDNNHLVFVISDTGIGMNDESLIRLFDRFEQADNSTTRKYGGTGIGMSITKSLVDLMRGEIEVASMPSVGTTFTVKLPLGKAKASKANSKKITKEVADFTGKKALLVEDNEINQTIASTMLESTNIEFVIANNGLEALDLINEEFDIVLMDIQMPEMDGFEALKNLKLRGFELPVIAMTANVLSEDLKAYDDAGFVSCVPKPVDKNVLISQMSKFLSLDG